MKKLFDDWYNDRAEEYKDLYGDICETLLADYCNEDGNWVFEFWTAVDKTVVERYLEWWGKMNNRKYSITETKTLKDCPDYGEDTIRITTNLHWTHTDWNKVDYSNYLNWNGELDVKTA